MDQQRQLQQSFPFIVVHSFDFDALINEFNDQANCIPSQIIVRNEIRGLQPSASGITDEVEDDDDDGNTGHDDNVKRTESITVNQDECARIVQHCNRLIDSERISLIFAMKQWTTCFTLALSAAVLSIGLIVMIEEWFSKTSDVRQRTFWYILPFIIIFLLIVILGLLVTMTLSRVLALKMRNCVEHIGHYLRQNSGNVGQRMMMKFITVRHEQFFGHHYPMLRKIDLLYFKDIAALERMKMESNYDIGALDTSYFASFTQFFTARMLLTLKSNLRQLKFLPANEKRQSEMEFEYRTREGEYRPPLSLHALRHAVEGNAYDHIWKTIINTQQHQQSDQQQYEQREMIISRCNTVFEEYGRGIMFKFFNYLPVTAGIIFVFAIVAMITQAAALFIYSALQGSESIFNAAIVSLSWIFPILLALAFPLTISFTVARRYMLSQYKRLRSELMDILGDTGLTTSVPYYHMTQDGVQIQTDQFWRIVFVLQALETDLSGWPSIRILVLMSKVIPDGYSLPSASDDAYLYS